MLRLGSRQKGHASLDADTALPKHRSLSAYVLVYVLVPGRFPDPFEPRRRFSSDAKRKENKVTVGANGRVTITRGKGSDAGPPVLNSDALRRHTN